LCWLTTLSSLSLVTHTTAMTHLKVIIWYIGTTLFYNHFIILIHSWSFVGYNDVLLEFWTRLAPFSETIVCQDRRHQRFSSTTEFILALGGVCWLIRQYRYFWQCFLSGCCCSVSGQCSLCKGIMTILEITWYFRHARIVMTKCCKLLLARLSGRTVWFAFLTETNVW